MRQTDPMHVRNTPLVRMTGCLGIAAVILLGGCAQFEQSGLPGSASSMARDQMMLVSREPATFGYYRLSSLMRIHPDLALFVDQRGVPDFLAETGSDDRDYYILYYLKSREAYVCRTSHGRGRLVEFAGPYPVTESEYRTLESFRKKETP
jgi:hypothetical protein